MSEKTSWTPARLRAFIISTLRSGSRRYPPKWEVLKEASVGKKINKKTNRLGQHYICNGCKGEFPSKEVEVNHIEPVVPLTGFTTWDDYISRLFCGKELLEVLCKPCHKALTKKENEMRKRGRVAN